MLLVISRAPDKEARFHPQPWLFKGCLPRWHSVCPGAACPACPEKQAVFVEVACKNAKTAMGPFFLGGGVG